MSKKIMRLTSVILIGLTFLISCNNQKQQQGQRELVPNPEKYAHDGYMETPDSINPKFKPDTLVGPISLINPTRVEEYFGKNVMDRLIDDGLPNSSVISHDHKQRLRFYFHPGNGANDFSEFKINYVQDLSDNETVVKDNEFKTESGIRLGMTMGELRAIKGEPHSLTQNETTIFHYKIDDFENSEFLKKYNMPLYYANYEFNNGYLIEFKFGFQYP